MWLWILSGFVIFFGFMAFTGAPYLPSKRKELEYTFRELCPLDGNDVLVDIGSGDGIVLREAIRQGAHRAYGVEINPFIAWVSRSASRKYKGRIKVKCANLWKMSFPAETTVVYAFSTHRDIEKMYKKVAQEASRLERTIRFVSYAFEVPGVRAEKTLRAHHLYEIKPFTDKKA